MTFPKNETTIGKINLLSRWIIFHSILYYEMNKSLVTDYMFDMNAKELYKMMSEYEAEFQQSKFYYVMKDFEGNSGFGLSDKLTKKDSEYFKRIISLNYLH